MKESAFQNSGREVSRRPRILKKRCFVSNNLQIFVQTNFKIRGIRVSFARHSHIFHPIQSVFDGSFQNLRSHRTESRPRIGLVFFAAKTTAQTGHVHFNLVHRQARHLRHGSLHSRWSLRGRIDFDAPIFGWHAVRPLRFDVEVFLPATFRFALVYIRAIRPRPLSITEFERLFRDN